MRHEACYKKVYTGLGLRPFRFPLSYFPAVHDAHGTRTSHLGPRDLEPIAIVNDSKY